MSERDELAAVVAKALGDVTGIYDTSHAEDVGIADAILAAGYRKPRTITTAEELDALPARATILDCIGHVWTNDGDSLDQWGSVTTTESYGGPKWLTSYDISFPASVLHEGNKP